FPIFDAKARKKRKREKGRGKEGWGEEAGACSLSSSSFRAFASFALSRKESTETRVALAKVRSCCKRGRPPRAAARARKRSMPQSWARVTRKVSAPRARRKRRPNE